MTPLGALQVPALGRFLGPGADEQRPAELLGIADDADSPEAVIAALETCLRRVDSHAEAATPAADEARLALHAAAARLLRERAGPARAVVGPALSPAALEADALIAVGLHGGWNPAAQTHLCRVAHARGLGNAAVATAIARLAARPAPAGPSAETFTLPPTDGTTEPTRAARRADRAGQRSAQVAVILGVAMLAAAAVVFAPRASKDPDVAATPDPAHAATPTAARPTPLPQAQPAPAAVPTRDPADWRVVLHDLRTASSDGTVDHDRASDALARAATLWVGFPHDAVRAIEATAVEHLLHASRDPANGEAALAGVLRTPTDPADALTAAVWQAGLLARLLVEPDLTMTVRAEARRALVDRAGPGADAATTFTQGVTSALRFGVDRIAVPGVPPSIWDAWRRALGAIDLDPPARAALVIAAIDAVARGRADDAAVIEPLVLAVDWSQGSPARRWLLDALLDPTHDPRALAVVTRTLATRSAAPGVDTTMILDPGAGELDRAALHDAYAAAWSLPGGSPPDDLAPLRAARDAIDAFPWPAWPTGTLARAVASARVAAAARRLWDGDAQGAASRLAGLPDDVLSVAAFTTASRRANTQTATDNEWARRFLAVGSALGPRLELIDTFPARAGAVSPANAQTLVDAALRSSPQQVRDRAAAVAAQLAPDPAVALALLEALPAAPRVTAIANLYEAFTLVPAGLVRSPDWGLATRRALVERIGESLTGTGEGAALDALAAALAAAYDDASLTPHDPSAPHESAPARLRERWLDIAPPAASPLLAASRSDAEIDRDRLARLGVARGPAQRFLAEQIAAVETVASATIRQRPDAADRVAGLLAATHAALATDQDVFTQIDRVEQLRLDLWFLRFEHRR